MIEGNSGAKSLLSLAFQAMNKDRINMNTEEVRDYQEEVRKRLREKKYHEES